MCLLTIHWQNTPAAPLVVAANREEYFDRPSLPPRILPWRVPVLCGIDERAGGTWLGVNSNSLFVAVTNRWGLPVPESPRSRGALCRDLLGFGDAVSAAEFAGQELASGRYAGANYVCIDQRRAFFVTNAPGEGALELEPGLHLLANRGLNDPVDARLALVRSLMTRDAENLKELVQRASSVCSLAADHDEVGVVLRFADRGTVSSSIVALAEDLRESIYLHSQGAPDVVPYMDYSKDLRGLLGALPP